MNDRNGDNGVAGAAGAADDLRRESYARSRAARAAWIAARMAEDWERRRATWWADWMARGKHANGGGS